ncbi:universal stress protein [candidate division KSB1 bacterium]|nr:universal stress protein [candidate division KSB1 bacterium]
MECTDDENNVIEEAIRLAGTLNADLSAFHVNDPAAGKAHMMMDSLPLVSEEDIQEQFRKAGYEKEATEIKITIAESESYAKEIAKATEDIDLLVIGHHSKNAFLAALIDSVDERVADLVSCPVLMVPK